VGASIALHGFIHKGGPIEIVQRRTAFDHTATCQKDRMSLVQKPQISQQGLEVYPVHA